AGSIDLTKGNISAKNDINLTADNGGVLLKGESQANSLNITSASGSVDIKGGGDSAFIQNASIAAHSDLNITGRSSALQGIYIDNANLTARNMNIYGDTNGLGAGNGDFGGVNIYRNVNFTVENKGVIHGVSHHSVATGADNLSNQKVHAAGIRLGGVFKGGVTKVNFKGDFDVTGEQYDSVDVNNTTARASGGVYFDGPVAVNAVDGDLNITGIGHGRIAAVMENGSSYNRNEKFEFVLNNANVSFNMSAEKYSAMDFGNSSDSYTQGLIFSGTGNVDVSARNSSTTDAALSLNLLDNAALNGRLTVDATNDSGDAIRIPGRVNVNVVNATISGHSEGNGRGVIIDASKTIQMSLGNNVINGDSVSGTGIQISGNNVTITNGTLVGKATDGNGSGVMMTGGNNYTLNGVNVSGHSVNGSGVVVDGTLNVNNGTTLTGNSSGTGNGVTVNGTLLSNGGVNICGTAISGNGVQVNGDTQLNNANVNGITTDGNGVNVAGNLTNNNTSI
ncbi:hypothetical protein KFT39_004789, partial [Salmonella enterica]|nr:hypothetical protein [Salmonella enterica]